MQVAIHLVGFFAGFGFDLDGRVVDVEVMLQFLGHGTEDFLAVLNPLLFYLWHKQLQAACVMPLACLIRPLILGAVKFVLLILI